MVVWRKDPSRPRPKPLLRAVDLLGISPEAPAEDANTDPLVSVRDLDPVDWIEGNFYIPPTGGGPAQLIRFMLFQKAITRLAFTRRDDGRFPFQTIVISSIKKSGKTTWVAAIERWLAETQVRYGELACIGNDEEQAKGREFKMIAESLELTPGYEHHRDRLAGRWSVQKKSMRCLTSNSVIRALSMDAKGEAGGRPYCTVWTELWGFDSTEARKFWTEMTPVPTIPDSMRIVESYAGFEGESDLLYALYERGKSGRQLTAGELAKVAARDKDGERYEDFLLAFEETGGDPDAPVPVWIEGRMLMFWDSGVEARRNKAEQTDEYYAEEEKTNPPAQYRRIHLNEWVSGESRFVEVAWWNACKDPDLPPLDRATPMILSLDAASTGDCFAAVAVTRHPQDYKRAALRASKIWRPDQFPDGRIDFEVVRAWVRDVCGSHNVVQVCYDPFQLEDMSQWIRRELEVWAEPFNQAKDRKIADRRLYDLIVKRELSWNLHDEAGEEEMRRHIVNANAKHQKDQDSTLLIVKKAEARKIDLVVAASMGVHRCLTLLMPES